MGARCMLGTTVLNDAQLNHANFPQYSADSDRPFGVVKKYCNSGDEDLVALVTGNLEIAEISTYETTTE